MASIFKKGTDKKDEQPEISLLTMQSHKRYGTPIVSGVKNPSRKKRKNARIVSAVLTILLSCAAAAFSFLPQFRVIAPEVSGIEQVNMEEIIYYTGLRDIPIYMSNPAQIRQVLLKRYPEIREMNVTVELPQTVRIEMLKRIPVIEWDFGGSKIWIDEDGTILKESPSASANLIYVLSNSFPGAKNKNDRKFPEKFSKKMMQSVIAINQVKPQGKKLFYTYDNGYGWETDYGYTLWVGIDDSELTEKMKMAESIEKYFKENEIQPDMLSLEFTQAPYYRYAE